MNERMLWDAIPLCKQYELNKRKVIEKLLKKLSKGMYSCTNEYGEDVLIIRKTVFNKKGKVREISGNGLELWTFQGNGFLSVDHYDEKGKIINYENKGKY